MTAKVPSKSSTVEHKAIAFIAKTHHWALVCAWKCIDSDVVDILPLCPPKSNQKKKPTLFSTPKEHLILFTKPFSMDRI